MDEIAYTYGLATERMKHLPQKWTPLLINGSILSTVMMYFLFPHQHYIATSVIFAIGLAFMVRHVRRRDLRGAVICGVGLLFVFLLLPDIPIIKESEALVLALVLVIGAIFVKRLKDPSSD